MLDQLSSARLAYQGFEVAASGSMVEEAMGEEISRSENRVVSGKWLAAKGKKTGGGRKDLLGSGDCRDNPRGPTYRISTPEETTGPTRAYTVGPRATSRP